jgi:hypothetical protein
MPRIFGYQISSADTLYGPLTLADGEGSPTALLTFPTATISYVQLQYGITRNGSTITGLMKITCDGTNVSLIDDNSSTGAEPPPNLGIVFSASIVGPNITLSYTTTATGHNGAMTYYQKIWQ